MFEVYKPSGRFGLSTIIYLLIGLVVAALLAFVYAYGLHYIPFIYISFVMTGAFGLALGFVGALVVNMGHCRSVLLASLIGLLLCVFGLAAKHYVQYGLWIGDATAGKIAYEIQEGNLTQDQAEVVRAELRGLIAKEISFLDHFQERADVGFTIGRRGNAGAYRCVYLLDLGD